MSCLMCGEPSPRTLRLEAENERLQEGHEGLAKVAADEIVRLRKRLKLLTIPCGIVEIEEQLADKDDEIERLKKKLEDVGFQSAVRGVRMDRMGLSENLKVIPDAVRIAALRAENERLLEERDQWKETANHLDEGAKQGNQLITNLRARLAKSVEPGELTLRQTKSGTYVLDAIYGDTRQAVIDAMVTRPKEDRDAQERRRDSTS